MIQTLWKNYFKYGIGLFIVISFMIFYQSPIIQQVIDQTEVMPSSTVSIAQGDHDSFHIANHKELQTIKNVKTESIDELIVGGDSIGMELKSKGLIIVGFHDQKDAKENNYSPGKEAGIKIGDIITHINKQAVESLEDLDKLIKESKSTDMTISILRNGNEITKKLEVDHSIKYPLGLYIKDKVTGIGTLTFIEPNSLQYGALGHVITDHDTNKPIHLNHGILYLSKVNKIQAGRKGYPGEKQASILFEEDALGTVTLNNTFGIFGSITEQSILKEREKMPIAKANEIKLGEAEILTVINGEKIERFDVLIEQNKVDYKNVTKGMIIKIVDERLLKETDGIVQGMSGSPIIQDGKIIGAVTHVFVNDPKKGYGVHIESMLDQLRADTNKADLERAS